MPTPKQVLDLIGASCRAHKKTVEEALKAHPQQAHLKNTLKGLTELNLLFKCAGKAGITHEKFLGELKAKLAYTSQDPLYRYFQHNSNLDFIESIRALCDSVEVQRRYPYTYSAASDKSDREPIKDFLFKDYYIETEHALSGSTAHKRLIEQAITKARAKPLSDDVVLINKLIAACREHNEYLASIPKNEHVKKDFVTQKKVVANLIELLDPKNNLSPDQRLTNFRATITDREGLTYKTLSNTSKAKILKRFLLNILTAGAYGRKREEKLKFPSFWRTRADSFLEKITKESGAKKLKK